MVIRERKLAECPKCGARGGCDKHGLTSTGIDLRARSLTEEHKAMMAQRSKSND